MKIKLKKRWIFTISVVLLVAGFFIYNYFSNKDSNGYKTEKVERGTVLQEVSETGSVKPTETINLSFKTVGKIAGINVAVGDDVKKGDILAELDASQLSAQLENAKAALVAADEEYNKLLNGLVPEDIKTYENAVVSAQQDLDESYSSAINTLNDAYAKIYNSYTSAVSMENSYFQASDQQGIKVQDSRKDINSNLEIVKVYLDKAEKSLSPQDIEEANARMLLVLDNVYNDLKIVREQCEIGTYFSAISSDDKVTLDTHRGYINTASTNVTSSKDDITSYKIALQKAKDNLTLKTAAARPEDVDIYSAKVKQAEANVALYQSQLNDNYLKSPIDGKITKVKGKKGEVYSAAEPLISLLSTEPFQIKVDIYEQDIVNVKIGDTARIVLVAFPKDTFYGKVLSIEPAEKIIDNVVYYETTLSLDAQQEGIKSGMTADIVIEANKKENALMIPNNAIEKIDGLEKVQVKAGKKTEDRIIQTGLEGNDYVEIISGLAEGEEIITGKK